VLYPCVVSPERKRKEKKRKEKKRKEKKRKVNNDFSRFAKS